MYGCWKKYCALTLALVWSCPVHGRDITPTVHEAEVPAADAVQGTPLAKFEGERHEIAADAPVELIQERYPNRAIRIERQVAQDNDGNYVNHGSWTMWDDKGRMVALGEFKNGVRHGTWSRWYNLGEGEMFTAPLYKQFQGPFTSEASFRDGKLHGTWTVTDNRKRKCSEWNFDNGERHGRSVTYFPTGPKMTESEYKHGQLEGDSVEWNLDGKVVQKDSFVSGRKLATKVDYFSPGVKRFEGVYLYGRQIIDTNYDFWNGIVRITAGPSDGNDQRHGQWTSWHKNGQVQLEGRYEDDVPSGKFVWWHSNGQKAIEGEYIAGKQIGKWVWWFENGQKSIQGEYDGGNPVAKWKWWREDGKVTKLADMSLEKDIAPVVTTMPKENISELKKGPTSEPTLQAMPATLPEGRIRR